MRDAHIDKGGVSHESWIRRWEGDHEKGVSEAERRAGWGYGPSGTCGPVGAVEKEDIDIAIVGALAFVYPSALGDVVGFICFAFVIVSQKVLRKGPGERGGARVRPFGAATQRARGETG